MHREELATARAGRSGREVVVGHQVALIRGALPRPCRVLEVGCGRGEVAAGLAAAGHTVTAIDPALADDVMAARNVRFEKAALEDFTDPAPYDAIAFTASLHHILALGPALDRAAALLVPGGVLVVDEFDLAAPDAASALWFFELQEMFAVAGLYDPARIEGKASQAPVERWRAAHVPHAAHARHAPRASGIVSGVIGGHAHELHAGAAMIAAIEQRFAGVTTAGGPYLYRYIAAGLRGPRAPWVAEAVHDAEKRRIGLGLMTAVGLQITARGR